MMMEDILTLKHSAVINNYKKAGIPSFNINTGEEIFNNPVKEKLYSEGRQMFYHYMKQIGLGNELNIMVLSSRHHYYDYKDFSGITALINQKKLNFVKHLDSFLHIVYRSLSEKASLIGCFHDKNSKAGNNIILPVYRRTICPPESDLVLEIDKIDVSEMLKFHGFKVVDITDIKELTYFRAQKLKQFKN
jgi:hypothetical protein